MIGSDSIRPDPREIKAIAAPAALTIGDRIFGAAFHVLMLALVVGAILLTAQS